MRESKGVRAGQIVTTGTWTELRFLSPEIVAPFTSNSWAWLRFTSMPSSKNWSLQLAKLASPNGLDRGCGAVVHVKLVTVQTVSSLEPQSAIGTSGPV
jgi:hypothetical protein